MLWSFSSYKVTIIPSGLCCCHLMPTGFNKDLLYGNGFGTTHEFGRILCRYATEDNDPSVASVLAERGRALWVPASMVLDC